VHGHLRLGQIEVFRRIATGCLSEMVGSAAIEVDRTLRLIGFGQAVAAMTRAFLVATRAWVEAYALGLNHALLNGPLPYELRSNQ